MLLVGLPPNFLCILLQQDDRYADWNNIYSRDLPPTNWPREVAPDTERPYAVNQYGLYNRNDIPPQSRPEPELGQNFAVYDPDTRQRTSTAINRNCTAPGCCVPKCFAEKGNRVSFMKLF